MPQRKKQHRKQSWLKTLGSYRVFSVPIGRWLFIGVLFALSGGAYYFFTLREYSTSTPQTFVSEVSDVQSQSYGDDRGSGINYWVWLKRDEKDLKCSVSPIQVQLWRELEIGKKYEFEVTLTQSRCFINGVTEVDDTGFSP